MKAMRRRFVTCLILLLTTTNLIFAQEEKQMNSLADQLGQIMRKSETYEGYKVIKTNELLQFKSSMLDSLMSYKSNIATLEIDFATLRGDFESLKAQFEQTQTQLLASQEQNASMSFLGLAVNKKSYNAVIWSFIALLIFSLGILYYRIKHVCAVVKRVKSAYSKIMDEYRTQRHQSVEKQIKLKRELQTMQNRLEMIQSLEETA